METNNKNANISLFASVILALLVMLCAIALGSCSSRKKTLDKNKTELKTESKVDSSGSSKLKLETKSEAKETAKEIETIQEAEYDGAQGDSLTVTEKDSKGNVVKQTTYKGKGKLKTKNSEKQSDKTTTETKAENKQSESKADVRKKESADKKEAGKKLDVKTEGVSIVFWIWLSLAVMLALLLLYLNHRFKWAKRVTAFFNK
jgi:cobalamin biosynthesis Mg chelatase CobN